jgi:hypothetical protein
MRPMPGFIEQRTDACCFRRICKKCGHKIPRCEESVDTRNIVGLMEALKVVWARSRTSIAFIHDQQASEEDVVAIRIGTAGWNDHNSRLFVILMFDDRPKEPGDR